VADSIYKGPLNGRFYRLSSALKRGTSLVDGCSRHSWVEGQGRGLRFYRSFCRGTLPHDGCLQEDPTDLAYADGDSGVWRLWFREETRKVGRSSVEEAAARMALDNDEGTPLSKMQRREKKQLLEQARRELLMHVIPSIRVVPVVVVDDWLWIGRKASVSDRSYVHMLRHVLGSLDVDPMLWSNDGPGWTACSYATLQAFVRSAAGELAPDVALTKVDIRGRSLHVRATQSADDIRSVLQEVARSTSEASIKKLSFEVYIDGTPIVVESDKHGVFRADPLRSAGGLPDERIRRRFGDVRQAAVRLRELMVEKVAELEDSGE